MTTQGAIFNYEEVIDLHTEVGRVSVIGLHTPTGDTPRRLCPGFFQQFKRYKYLGCSVSVVPVATLPADPLSVSYEAGEERLIDPRDLANPMMFHGCHGNDLGNILNRLYSAGLVDGNDLTQILRSDSIDLMNMFNGDDDGEPVLQLLENLYYRALTDNTWKKAHIQRGFRKSGLRPRIYSLATNMQIQNAGALGGFNAPGPFQGDLNLDPLDPEDSGFADLTDPTVNPVRYFTPRTVPLGWLDTRQVIPYVPEGNVGDVPFADLDDTIAGLVRGKTIWNELPKIFMGVILMPPAYRIEQYFRVIINHAFAFKGFRGISMSNDMLDMPPNYENWNELLSAGEGGDEHEPDPPEPVPTASLVLRALIGDNFRGAFYTAVDEVSRSAVLKSAFQTLAGYGWQSVNASEPYGFPQFHMLDGADRDTYYYWDSDQSSLMFKAYNASPVSKTSGEVYSALSSYVDFTNMDSDKLLDMFKQDVTDINAS